MNHTMSLTMCSTRTSQASASRGTTRDRGALNMLSCDQCRIDKQKCSFPPPAQTKKCSRCTKRRTPCSGPKRAIRSPKKDKNLDVGVPFDESVLNDVVTSLITLVMYRKNFQMALGKITSIEQEMRRMFPSCIEDLNGATYKSSFEELNNFHAKLNHHISIQMGMLRDTVKTSKSHSWNDTFEELFLWQETLWEADECELCSPASQENLVKERPLSKGKTRVLPILQVLARCCHACRYHGPRARIESSVKLDLISLVRTEAYDTISDILSRHGLLRSSYGSINPVPYFIPDAIVDCIMTNPDILQAEDLQSQTDAIHRTLLHQLLDINAARHEGPLIALIKIASGIPISYSQKDSLGRTPLHIACLKGNTSVALELLERDVQINYETVHGFNALHLAAARGSLKICQMLRQRGADLQATGPDGRTARDYAMIHNHFAVADFLSDGFDPVERLPSLDPDSSLLRAFTLGCAIDPRMVTRKGETVLHVYVRRGTLESVNWLLKHGPDVQARDAAKRTPLMLAVKKGSLAIVNALLDSVKDGRNLSELVHAKDRRGRTALNYAFWEGHDHLVPLLEEAMRVTGT